VGIPRKSQLLKRLFVREYSLMTVIKIVSKLNN